MPSTSQTWGYLGKVKFRLLSSPSILERDVVYKFAEHHLIGSKPKLQNVGQELDIVNIEIEFNEHFCNPEEKADEIEKYAREQQPLSFVLQSGRNFGYFIIDRINSLVKGTHQDGQIKIINLALSLREYKRSKKEERKDKNQYNLVKE